VETIQRAERRSRWITDSLIYRTANCVTGDSIAALFKCAQRKVRLRKVLRNSLRIKIPFLIVRVYYARRNINFTRYTSESLTKVRKCRKAPWVVIFVAAWKCATEKSLASASISLVYLRACCLLDRSAEFRIEEDEFQREISTGIECYLLSDLTFNTALEIGIESTAFCRNARGKRTQSRERIGP
jgi:hypothetical protein